MNELCSCFSTITSPPIHITLPHSPNWIKYNYKNLDCQPGKEVSGEKHIAFHRNLLKLINYPLDKYIIKKYENHPDGPIKTYLEWQIIKKRKLFCSS